jgi:superfamily II DNA or RNA helicase
MEVTIVRDGSWSHATSVDGRRDDLFNLVDPVLSYPVPGAFHSEKYQLRVWDGRARLQRKPRGTEAVAFPAGMTDRVVALLKSKGHTVSCSIAGRPICVPPVTPVGPWTGHTLREHQEAAVGAVMKAMRRAQRDPSAAPGGVLKMPIRSGKTLTAAAIAHRADMKVLFLAPSEHLLYQTQEAIRDAIGEVKVGLYGNGKRETDAPIIVGTYQTLAAGKTSRVYETLRKQPLLLILDEAHHQGSDGTAWRQAVLGLNPTFTLALSATFDESIFDDDNPPDDLNAAMWIRGIAGPLLYTVSMAELTEKGYLVPTTIQWVDHAAPKFDKRGMSWPTVYRMGVVENQQRNEAIVEVAAQWVEDGRRVLIDTAQIGHTRLLNRALKARLGGCVAMVTGSTKTLSRRKTLESFRSGKIMAIVGTVLGEGVDIPELEVVINAAGESGAAPTIQRLRCMTPCRGKDRAWVVEMMDDHHLRLAEHAESRMNAYSAEDVFDFEFRGVDP